MSGPRREEEEASEVASTEEADPSPEASANDAPLPEIEPEIRIAPTKRRQRLSARTWLDVGLGSTLFVSTAFVVIHQLLTYARLQRGVALFVGVPALLGVFAAATQPRGAVARAMKYVTICLCLLAPMLGEGMVCIVMAAPIVYIVAALIAAGVSRPDVPPGFRAFVLAPFLFAMMVRTPVDQLPLVTARDSVVVDAPPDVVWGAIEHLQIALDPNDVPVFLRVGFPVPQAIRGGGLAIGSVRRVVFDRGTVVARVTASERERSFSVALSIENVGHEFFDQWVALERATFTLEPLPGHRTRLVHETWYRRLLDPAIYFAPVEHYGIDALQQYLLEQCATRIVAERR